MKRDAIEVCRLSVDDIGLAQRTFRLMAEVFEEPSGLLSEAYVSSLLSREEFWALAAVTDDMPIGGVTAHALEFYRALGGDAAPVTVFTWERAP